MKTIRITSQAQSLRAVAYLFTTFDEYQRWLRNVPTPQNPIVVKAAKLLYNRNTLYKVTDVVQHNHTKTEYAVRVYNEPQFYAGMPYMVWAIKYPWFELVRGR